MTRSFGAAAVLTAALGIGCNGGEGSVGAPTAPTSTPSTTTSGSNPPTTQSCLPAAPENFKVTVTNGTRAFSWNAVSNVQDYFIQIARVGSEDYLVNTNTTHTNYSWTGDPPGNYWARVYARNSCGSGPNSQQVFFN